METTGRNRQLVSSIGGALLVLLGTLFLLQQLFDLNLGVIFWPFYVIVPGLLCLLASFSDQRAGWLAIPGSIVTTVGLILLFQATTGRYETWAYAWALVAPFAVGVGTLLMGLSEAKPEQIESGRTLTAIGLVLFLVFGAFFELLFFRGELVSGIIWPVVLIAAGLIMLFVRGQRPVRQ